MNAKIVVASDKVVNRNITTKANKEMTFREQRAALQIAGEDFPHPFNINLDKDQPPYPPGDYTIDLSCLKVGDFEQLTVGRLKLVPMTRATPVRAAG